MSSIKPKVSSPTKARITTRAKPVKAVDPNALPVFKPPVVKAVQPTAPILPTVFAISEQIMMEQRLHALKVAMAEERAKREETMRHRELNPVNQISGSEYRSQLKERLARKTEAMKEKQAALAGMMKNVDLSTNPHAQTVIQPVSQSINQSVRQPIKSAVNQSPVNLATRTSQSITIEQLNNPNHQSVNQSINQSISYVPPVRSNDLSAFQAVSERWLNDEKEVMIDGGLSNQSTNLLTNWLDSLREAQPAPRPVISLAHEQPINQSISQSSLIDGDAFDEAESTKYFQEARLAWLSSMQRLQTAKKDSSAGTINQSINQSTNRDAPDSQSTRIVTRPTTASTGSLLDGPGFDESQSANAFAEARKEWLNSLNASSDQSINQSNQSNNAPRPMIEASEERFCCYHCYRLVPLRQCVLSRSGKQPQQMCSETCRNKFEHAQKQQSLSLVKATSDLVRGVANVPVDVSNVVNDDDERVVAPVEPVVHLSRPQTASSFDRPTTAMTGRVIHTVTNSVVQPKPKVQFPDDD